MSQVSSIKCQERKKHDPCSLTRDPLGLKTQTGQSLLEVMFALFVIVVISLAFLYGVTTALNNANFAKNQANASKLVQDALEKMRGIRDEKLWQGFFALGPRANGTGCFGNIEKDVFTNQWTIDSIPCGEADAEKIPVDTVVFKREILINCHSYGHFDETIPPDPYPPQDCLLPNINTGEQNNDEQRKVIVTVWWDDQKGKHKARQSTFLSKWSKT